MAELKRADVGGDGPAVFRFNSLRIRIHDPIALSHDVEEVADWRLAPEILIWHLSNQAGDLRVAALEIVESRSPLTGIDPSARPFVGLGDLLGRVATLHGPEASVSDALHDARVMHEDRDVLRKLGE